MPPGDRRRRPQRPGRLAPLQGQAGEAPRAHAAPRRAGEAQGQTRRSARGGSPRVGSQGRQGVGCRGAAEGRPARGRAPGREAQRGPARGPRARDRRDGRRARGHHRRPDRTGLGPVRGGRHGRLHPRRGGQANLAAPRRLRPPRRRPADGNPARHERASAGRPLTTSLALRWADIDLGALGANCARILAHLPHGARLLSVVKAGGYGHGALPAAKAALSSGATGLAVATIEEARELGALVPPEDILVMGGLTSEQARAAASGGWCIAVSTRELASALGDAGEMVPVHLKIDTGMGRFGCPPEGALALARFIDQTPGLRLAGTWTHFASSDTDDAMTRRQFDLFTQTLKGFDVDPGLRHACNSIGAYNHPDFALDAVRCGIATYGCEWPGTEPVMALRAVVTHVKTVDAGASVGYGATWKATGKTRVATVAIGYADGVHRSRSNRGQVLVRGRRAPLIGVVSMDAITLDVRDVPGVQVGEHATHI